MGAALLALARFVLRVPHPSVSRVRVSPSANPARIPLLSSRAPRRERSAFDFVPGCCTLRFQGCGFLHPPTPHAFRCCHPEPQGASDLLLILSLGAAPFGFKGAGFSIRQPRTHSAVVIPSPKARAICCSQSFIAETIKLCDIDRK